MKSSQENRSLTIAIAVSVLAHAALLAVKFVAPDAFHFEPADPGLEVILVNARHDHKPLKAEALAQVDLDGGGSADAGRSKSPLPDMHKVETGQNVKAAQRRVSELEQVQRNLLTKVKKSDFNSTPLAEKLKPEATPRGLDLLEASKAIARSAAEITQTIEDQNKRPRKTFLTPSTRGVGYAQYYKEMAAKIEKMGTLNFPEQGGRKLYGKLTLYIPIFQDGTIYTAEGGIEVRISSGNRALDQAAKRIVERSAPFGRFPPKMLSKDKDDLWVVISTFEFTREGTVGSQLLGEVN
ncbi:MAG: TonB C-terminal domain-containing protein [Pseudomonadota bacterium]